MKPKGSERYFCKWLGTIKYSCKSHALDKKSTWSSVVQFENQRNLPVDVLVTDELVACGEGDDFT